MATSNIDAEVASIIAKNGQWIADSATQIWVNQWASAASMARNEKEQAEFEKIGTSLRYTITAEGSSVSVRQEQLTESPFQSVIEQGLSGLVSGGHDGFVTEPDGTTRESNVNPNLRGQSVDFLYARPADPVSDGINTINGQKIPEWAQEEFNSSKGEITSDIIRPMIIEKLQSIIH
jgi:hypothetical protein